MIEVDAPLDTVPMFVRAGAIIPKGPVMNYVGEKPSAPQFVIYPDDKGQAETTLYEDDGLSPAYKKGAFRRTRVKLSAASSIGPRGRRGRRLTVEPTEGTFNPEARVLEFVVPIPDPPGRGPIPSSVLIDGKLIPQGGRGGIFWSKRGNTLVIRVPDDGKADVIEIRYL